MANDITIKICIESKLTYLPLIRQIVRAICSIVTQNEQIFQDIDLALTEALSNIINHAYQNEPDHEIQILVILSSKEIVFQIIDSGLKNMNIDKPLPQLDFNLNDIESIPESGRGVFIIHQVMNEVVYKHEDGKNVLFMRKRFK